MARRPKSNPVWIKPEGSLVARKMEEAYDTSYDNPKRGRYSGKIHTPPAFGQFVPETRQVGRLAWARGGPYRDEPSSQAGPEGRKFEKKRIGKSARKMSKALTAEAFALENPRDRKKYIVLARTIDGTMVSTSVTGGLSEDLKDALHFDTKHQAEVHAERQQTLNRRYGRSWDDGGSSLVSFRVVPLSQFKKARPNSDEQEERTFNIVVRRGDRNYRGCIIERYEGIGLVRDLVQLLQPGDIITVGAVARNFLQVEVVGGSKVRVLWKKKFNDFYTGKDTQLDHDLDQLCHAINC